MAIDPIVVSYSELDTYRQCPLKHQLAYLQRWTKPLEPSDRRSRGTLWHQVMEDHYEYLKDMWSTRVDSSQADLGHIQALRDLAIARHLSNPEPTGEQDENQELVQWMYEGYLDNYGLDTKWIPLLTEQKFEVPLPDSFNRASRYHLKMRIDLVVFDLTTGALWVVDHKSGQNLPDQMSLELDDQFGLYTWGLRELQRRGELDTLLGRYNAFPILGSIHNAVRTQRNVGDRPGGKGKAQTMEQRMRRTYLNRSDVELDSIAHDAYAAAYNAHPPKSRTRPLYSSPDPRQCSWKCDFKEIHLAARTGVDVSRALTDFGFVQDFTRH